MTNAFSVTTTEETHRFTTATDYTNYLNENGPSILVVEGDGDIEGRLIQLRCFILDHVIDYGWEQ